jgi:hypothetical protein
VRCEYIAQEPDGLFVTVTDPERVDSILVKRFKKKDKLVGQLFLSVDVAANDGSGDSGTGSGAEQQLSPAFLESWLFRKIA